MQKQAAQQVKTLKKLFAGCCMALHGAHRGCRNVKSAAFLVKIFDTQKMNYRVSERSFVGISGRKRLLRDALFVGFSAKGALFGAKNHLFSTRNKACFRCKQGLF